MAKKVVIIGSGLGGLSCGVILSKNGYDVTVLEQGSQIGGCLQCFKRNGIKYETGMHFIGSADDNQVLDKLLKYLEVRKDISLSRLDVDGYDVVSLQGEKFSFANGKENFVEKLSSYFPNQKDNLNKYYEIIDQISASSTLHFLRYAESDVFLNAKYQLLSVNSVLDQLFDDETLKNVLSGNIALYAAQRNKTPFSTHAFITEFYNKSSFRIVGGSDIIAISMKNTIEKYNGKVITNQKVSKIISSNFVSNGVETEDGNFYGADYVISDAHPARTIELMGEKIVRPAFKNRVFSMPQSIGCFSVYMEFKENTVPYMNYNFYGYSDSTPWYCEDYNEDNWPKGFLYMHFCHSEHPKFAQSGIIISYMRYEELAKWFGTEVGKRGEDYEVFKQQKAEIVLNTVEKSFPGFKNSIKRYYTSTPLTYYNYTGTQNGSMYGISKDVAMLEYCRIPYKTRLKNVFQTGQNINSHGILGVLVGTIVTCSEFLTAEKIYNQITVAQ